MKMALFQQINRCIFVQILAIIKTITPFKSKPTKKTNNYLFFSHFVKILRRQTTCHITKFVTHDPLFLDNLYNEHYLLPQCPQSFFFFFS